MLLNWLLKRPPKGATKASTKEEAKEAVKESLKPEEPASTPIVIETEKKKQLLLDKCMDVMKERFTQESRSLVSCDYPGTENKAYLYMEQDMKDPTLRRLSTRVVRKGTDLCVMHFIYKGTAEEMTAYLGDKSHIPSLLESWQQLSDSADKKN